MCVCVCLQHKAGLCNCGNGANCYCKSGVGSSTFPPPQGWPPPTLVFKTETQTKIWLRAEKQSNSRTVSLQQS